MRSLRVHSGLGQMFFSRVVLMDLNNNNADQINKNLIEIKSVKQNEI